MAMTPSTAALDRDLYESPRDWYLLPINQAIDAARHAGVVTSGADVTHQVVLDFMEEQERDTMFDPIGQVKALLPFSRFVYSGHKVGIHAIATGYFRSGDCKVTILLIRIILEIMLK